MHSIALAILIALLALSGCAGKTKTLIETVTVQVPVFEPCDVDVPTPLRYATEDLRPGDSDFEKIRALLVERRQRMTVEEELRLLLTACTEELKTPPG
jgi:hypothetical protein